jgi:YVTN family beta-propeller protein
MQPRMAFAALLVAGSACAAIKAAPSLAPLGEDGEVHVYVLPLPRDSERLSFAVEAVSLARQDGVEAPLQVAQRELAGRSAAAQRLLAWGRVPPGGYATLAVTVASAALGAEGARSRLLVEPGPSRAELAFRVRSAGAVVVWLRVEPGSVRGDYSFAPRFTATLPPQTPPQAALYCTNEGSASVTAVDRRSRLVTGVLPVGGTPRGIALDPVARRAYVALFREDQLEILDVAASASMGRIRLSPGDGPGDVALAPDGTLLVVNERSRTVSFVAPSSLAELGRVPVGEDPTSLLLDRSGRFAYVANRGSATVTVIDVANRVVFGTIATDPEPLRVQLSRDGGRLYVVHRGSAELAAFAVPSLAPQARVYVGLGVTTMKVDPRTDLIYLSRGGERRISVHDPISLQPVDQLEAPGAVSFMAIDDAENTLLALVPERRAVAVVDLTSRELRAEIPVGVDPYTIALAGERP